VIGLFVYAVVVTRFKTFSGYAGVLALALIVIPVVIRTTENMLQLVPARFARSGLCPGHPKWKVILSITLARGPRWCDHRGVAGGGPYCG
jgi:phosphate transport system permease protein